MTQRSGPVDAHTWPGQLVAQVVEPGPSPRIHGYGVEEDLSRHYGFVDIVLLAHTGELPEPGARRALEIALAFLSPVSVSEGPCHAGVLASICGSRSAAKAGVVAMLLAQEAAFILSAHEPWLAWLRAPSLPAPAQFSCGDELERDSVRRLRDALHAIGFSAPGLQGDPTRMAAVLAVMHSCGLVDSASLACAMVLARLPCCIAESSRVSPGSFDQYPMNLPPFAYCEEP